MYAITQRQAVQRDLDSLTQVYIDTQKRATTREAVWSREKPAAPPVIEPDAPHTHRLTRRRANRAKAGWRSSGIVWKNRVLHIPRMAGG